MSEAFRGLYEQLIAQVGATLATEYYNEGYSSYQAGRYDEAIDLLQKVVFYDAQHVRAVYTLGRSYEESGDNESAISCFDRVIEQFPGTEYAGYAQSRRNNLAAGN